LITGIPELVWRAWWDDYRVTRADFKLLFD